MRGGDATGLPPCAPFARRGALLSCWLVLVAGRCSVLSSSRCCSRSAELRRRPSRRYVRTSESPPSEPRELACVSLFRAGICSLLSGLLCPPQVDTVIGIDLGTTCKRHLPYTPASTRRIPSPNARGTRRVCAWRVSLVHCVHLVCRTPQAITAPLPARCPRTRVCSPLSLLFCFVGLMLFLGTRWPFAHCSTLPLAQTRALVSTRTAASRSSPTTRVTA